jgi:cytochrome P450
MSGKSPHNRGIMRFPPQHCHGMWTMGIGCAQVPSVQLAGWLLGQMHGHVEGQALQMENNTALPQATLTDTAAFLLDVFLPNLAKGPIIRRPRAVALAQRLGLDDRAIRRMTKLDRKYPQGPLLLRLPGRNQALILKPGDLHQVLHHSPEPFSPASSEKRAALAHFEPRNVLISPGPERTVRRALQEQALDTNSPVHRLAGSFLPVVRQEADLLLERMDAQKELTWEDFTAAWHWVVRRVVFGDTARDDHEITDLLARLRKDANWSFLKPQRRELRDRFLHRVQVRMQTAEPGSLASAMAAMEPGSLTAPVDQIPQWLFAFDPAGMATFRTLALLATHDEQSAQAGREVRHDTSDRQHLPYLRACVLESLRLWPTTPMILRQTTQPVHWDTGSMPAGCGVLIFTPYFHRDTRHLPHAHSFQPQTWLTEGTGDTGWPRVPFSEGPAACPGRHLVLMLTSAMIARLIEKRRFSLASAHPMVPGQKLPGTLNHFTLRFTAEPAA